METIKERADKYIGHSYQIDESNAISQARQAYINGALEQEFIDRIDIEEKTKEIINQNINLARKNLVDDISIYICNRCPFEISCNWTEDGGDPCEFIENIYNKFIYSKKQ